MRELLSVPEDHDHRKDEHHKLRKELEALNFVFLLCLCLNPRTDYQQTENPDEAIDREENKETKKDIIEGPHLLSGHIISDGFASQNINYASAADDTTKAPKKVTTCTARLRRII